MTDTFEFTLDEESEKRLYDILTDVDTEKTLSFTITDKYGHTAEYVKVVHGKWIPWKYHDGFRCEKCNEPVYNKHNYCPSCGAKQSWSEQDE